jgi:hypothetical protein
MGRNRRKSKAVETEGLPATNEAGQPPQRALPETESVSETVASESELWAYKRECQARDIARLNSGEVTNEQMSWFPKGWARKAKLINSPL